MKAKLIRIGDSRGVCIPKPLIDQAGLIDDVQLKVVGTAIIVQSDSSVRSGWEDAARGIAGLNEDGIIDEPLPTEFDESEWIWE